jgi:hypothetical protein
MAEKKRGVETTLDEPMDYPRSIFASLKDVRAAPLGSFERMLKLAQLEDELSPYAYTTQTFLDEQQKLKAVHDTADKMDYQRRWLRALMSVMRVKGLLEKELTHG